MDAVRYTQEQLAMLGQQVALLQVRHPKLALAPCAEGGLAVRGALGFLMEHKGRSIDDEFRIKLSIPADYPASPPDAYEVSGRLDGFNHVFRDGRLCLGAPVEVRMHFAESPNLLSFIERMIIPFLFAFSYKARYGKMPFGELAHGTAGILDYYIDFFETSKESTIALLKCLANDRRQEPEICPCGSGRKLKKCHGQKLNALRPHQTTRDTEDFLKEMVSACRTVGKSQRKLLPRRLRRELERQLTNPRKAHPRGRRVECSTLSSERRPASTNYQPLP